MSEINNYEGLYKRTLQSIVDGNNGKCECEHDNENCCVLVDEYCPYCMAAVTLATDLET